MDHIEIKEISADLLQKLETEAQSLSKSGTWTGLAALGGAALASLFPAVGAIAAVTVVGLGAISAAYKLNKKLNLDEEVTGIKDIIREAQIQLTAEGIYKNAVDGVIGPLTQTAIMEFQSTKGLKKTGVLDENTQKELRP